jgi:thioredoxin
MITNCIHAFPENIFLNGSKFPKVPTHVSQNIVSFPTSWGKLSNNISKIKFPKKIYTLCWQRFQGIKNSHKKFWHTHSIVKGKNRKAQMSKKITQTNFNEEALSGRTLSLIQFKTDWKGSCQIVSMIYDDLAKSYNGTANFFTIDFETEILLVNKYGVREVPTILFYKNGKLVDHAVGLISKNVLISKIENALSN